MTVTIYSSFNYEETGGQSDSKTVGNTTTETSSSFSTDLSSQTSVDLTQTDLTYSEWKLTKGGKTLGHAYINSGSETLLEQGQRA